MGAHPQVGPRLPAGPTGQRRPGTAPQGKAAGPEGRGLGTRGCRFLRGSHQALPLTFSSTQLTMMDGYLRLSQRKNAGTPIAVAQREAAAWPANECNLRNKQEQRARAPPLPPTCAPATGSDVTAAPPGKPGRRLESAAKLTAYRAE